ncbi:unnamed protein product [Prunus armeniaca]
MGTGARVLWEWGRKNHREGAMGLDGEIGEPRRNRGGGGVGFWVLPRESGLLEEGAMGFWVLRKDGVGDGGRNRFLGSAQGGVGCGGVGEKSQIRIGFGMLHHLSSPSLKQYN